ncbi:MAG: Dabb family protein [Siphonobacter sp.]
MYFNYANALESTSVITTIKINVTMDRRSFVKSSAAAVAATPVMEQKLTFVHHVYFWLKNPKSKADHDQLLSALKGLRKIPTIRLAHIGKPVVTEPDKTVTDATYTFSVMLVFDSAEDEYTYLVHPLHKEFVEKNKHLWSKVMVYDSELL